MHEGDEQAILDDIAENAFFHDFLLFVREVGKRPVNLTKTGNLKRAEIYYFGQHFLIDIYHRDAHGLIMFPILKEDEAPYLVRIRALAQVMNLVRKRKDRLYLTDLAKEYLTLTPQEQFEEVLLAAFNRCNWGYLHPALYRVAEVLQNNQEYLWEYFVRHKDTPLDFQTFFQGVCAYFGVKNTNEYRDSAKWAFERVLVKDLCLYGLMQAKIERVFA